MPSMLLASDSALAIFDTPWILHMSPTFITAQNKFLLVTRTPSCWALVTSLNPVGFKDPIFPVRQQPLLERAEGGHDASHKSFNPTPSWMKETELHLQPIWLSSEGLNNRSIIHGICIHIQGLCMFSSSHGQTGISTPCVHRTDVVSSPGNNVSWFYFVGWEHLYILTLFCVQWAFG